MASAVDARHPNASPPASSGKTPGASSPSDPKLNSVAHEVAVIATGARPGNAGERELFTEETATVLVFENGGVLRLTAAVAPGQLLFLTNKETRREVVAQVTRKRDFKPTSCYVEVEFSEPSAGFWGVDFPVTPQQLAPVTLHQKEAAELVRSAKVVSGKPTAPAPSTHEVTALKEEVETLREQLKLLQTQAAAASPSAPANAPAPVVISYPPPSPVPPGARPEQSLSQSQTISSVPNETSSNLPNEASETPPSHPPVAPPESSAFPIEPGGSFSETISTPKPVIRISRSTKSRPSAGGSFRAKPLLITLLSSAALVAAFGVAWYLHWIPGLDQPKPVSAGAPPIPAAQPAPASGAVPPAAKADAEQLAPAGENPAPSTLAKSEMSANADATVDPLGPQVESGATQATLQRATPRASLKTAASPAAVPSQGTATVPPKLIKSVRAIASPNALEYFAHDKTATVTLDAVVDATGRVKSMKVLSGPASLRESAINALKQYRYEPATLRGKPVAAHVTVPVKFLFEP
ncbi:MAG TPA: energy transducer TonB [Candidatus Acidoferrum sp.]|nr:energy transducer TonB [Candidatus Acidoferrum sp.]